ncbi:MAG TPA: hypothetical protein PKD67_05810 [Ignavibacteriaceae bacterium]|mgnify:CR=1 FL=1|nr:hypothetical protein [Ignavibacteriaceae bacterium]
MKNIFFVFAFLILASNSFAQISNNNLEFSGNLQTDAKRIVKNYQEPVSQQLLPLTRDKKSPVLAGILSLLVPGAGEIYTGEYLKAGIFVALEAAVLTTAVIYDNKGDRKTNEFQDYADAYTNPDHNWSVVRYAEWLNQYEITDPNKKININPDESLAPWDRVNWSELNAAESGSHKLPPHGEQQYYELIGKYHQYSSGWNDFTGGGNKDQVSPNLIYYSHMRGQANDFYSVASTAVVGIYVNHFLSALDAVWSSIQHNKDLSVKLRIENIQLTNRAEFYPALHLSYNF